MPFIFRASCLGRILLYKNINYVTNERKKAGNEEKSEEEKDVKRELFETKSPLFFWKNKYNALRDWKGM